MARVCTRSPADALHFPSMPEAACAEPSTKSANSAHSLPSYTARRHIISAFAQGPLHLRLKRRRITVKPRQQLGGGRSSSLFVLPPRYRPQGFEQRGTVQLEESLVDAMTLNVEWWSRRGAY